MLRRMLGVDSWLDVASLENVEEDHSFLFLKKNLTEFFFFLNFENLNFSKELKILNFFFEKFGNLEFLKEFEKIWLMKFFLFFSKWPKKYEPNAPSPKAFFENFLFFFWKIYNELFFFFFFFEKPILWMRITLAGSWCGLLDKSLLNSCKKIISISNEFIHWNELEVLTQCP